MIVISMLGGTSISLDDSYRDRFSNPNEDMGRFVKVTDLRGVTWLVCVDNILTIQYREG